MAAASTSHLLLTRIDHEAKMLNVMRNLFEDGHLTDVTLACEGQLIHAHKLILSSVSNYFQTIFQNPMLRNQNNPVIVVKDMKLTDLKAIIEFVYSGEVRICGDQLESLVKSAETLDISGLNRIDPNPVNHKASLSSNKSIDSTENSIDSSFEKKSTTGSNGKSISHDFHEEDSSFLHKESGKNSKTSCDKKSEASSVRGTRSRCPLEPSEGNSGSVSQGIGSGRKGSNGGSAQENIASSKDTNPIANETKNRELRYKSRLQLKEEIQKIVQSKQPNKSTNGNVPVEAKTLRDRRSSSSICEPIAKGKNSTNGKVTSNSTTTTNGDQTKNENDCFKELTSDPKLTNISNKTPEFKKPLELAKRSKGNVPPEVYPPTETDDYMRQFVCNKERLSMNLKRDDDNQSVSSVTTRSRRSKLLEESDTNPLPPQTVSPPAPTRTGTSTRGKKSTTSSKPSTGSQKSKQVKKPEPVKPEPQPIATSRSTRSLSRGDSSRWKARAAKLKAAVATTRLTAKSRSNRVDWKVWFENQAKLLQNAAAKQRARKEERAKLAEKTKNDETSLENDKSTQRPSLNAPSCKSIPISHMPNPFARSQQNQVQNQPQSQQQLLNTNQQTNSQQYQQSTLNPNLIQKFNNDFELEFSPNPNSNPKPKRKQTDPTLEVIETAKRELASSSQATVTRNLRPKRVKTTSDSSDNPPSTANTSGSSLYTTVSLSSSPPPTTSNLTSPIQQQPSGDTDV